jgi:phage major head subunit gpT-like protein
MVLVEGFFLAGYEENPGLTAQFCNRVVSNQRMIDYRDLGAAPRMREWFDEIQPQTFNADVHYPVTVRDWEATLNIPKTHLQADQLGQYALKAREMGGFARQHPDELVAALIAAANTTLCYDGQYWCDDDHSEGDSGTQSNVVSTSGDDTVAHITTDLASAIAKMQRFKDDRGNARRIGSRPGAVWDLVCRPEALPLFDQLSTSTEISSSSNQWKGRLRVTSIPELSAAGNWYLIYAEGPVKPAIAQFQGEPTVVKTLGPESEHCLRTGNCWFSNQGHYTVAPGDWRLIIRIA